MPFASVISTGTPYAISLFAVIATFYGIHYTNKTNIRLQNDRLETDKSERNRELLRAKGEDLVTLINSFENDFRNSVSTLVKQLNSEDDQSVILRDLDLKPNTSMFSKINMLTVVYFPTALPTLIELDKRRFGKFQTLGIHLLEELSQTQRHELAKAYLRCSIDVGEQTEKLQKEIVSLLQNLHGSTNAVSTD